MGSSGSSKCTVPNIGIDKAEKKMIIDEHGYCILKRKLKKIKEKYGDSFSEYEQWWNKIKVEKKNKWFVYFIENKLNETDRSNFRNKCGSSGQKNVIEDIFSKYSDRLDDEIYNKMDNDEKKEILSNFELKVIKWYYAWIGSHRVLQLDFECRLCNKTKYIELDKDTSGKNIDYAHNSYDPPDWWERHKKYPSKTYTFNDILDYFKNASNKYNWATNNCKDFAKSIFDKIK